MNGIYAWKFLFMRTQHFLYEKKYQNIKLTKKVIQYLKYDINILFMIHIGITKL